MAMQNTYIAFLRYSTSTVRSLWRIRDPRMWWKVQDRKMIGIGIRICQPPSAREDREGLKISIGIKVQRSLKRRIRSLPSRNLRIHTLWSKNRRRRSPNIAPMRRGREASRNSVKTCILVLWTQWWRRKQGCSELLRGIIGKVDFSQLNWPKTHIRFS